MPAPEVLLRMPELSLSLVDKTPQDICKVWLPVLSNFLTCIITGGAVYFSGKKNAQAVIDSARANAESVIQASKESANASIYAATQNTQMLQMLNENDHTHESITAIQKKRLEAIELLCEAYTDTIYAQDCLADVDRATLEANRFGIIENEITTTLRLKRIEAEELINKANKLRNFGMAKFKLYFDYADVDNDYAKLDSLFDRLNEAKEMTHFIELEKDALQVMENVKKYI